MPPHAKEKGEAFASPLRARALCFACAFCFARAHCCTCAFCFVRAPFFFIPRGGLREPVYACDFSLRSPRRRTIPPAKMLDKISQIAASAMST